MWRYRGAASRRGGEWCDEPTSGTSGGTAAVGAYEAGAAAIGMTSLPSEVKRSARALASSRGASPALDVRVIALELPPANRAFARLTPCPSRDALHRVTCLKHPSKSSYASRRRVGCACESRPTARVDDSRTIRCRTGRKCCREGAGAAAGGDDGWAYKTFLGSVVVPGELSRRGDVIPLYAPAI